MTDPRGTLEKDLRRLHEIVELLERKDLELDQAIVLFEEGTKLLQEVERLLAQAEGRLKQLVDVQGRSRLAEMPPPENDPR